MEEIYVSVDIESDGPIPGDNSMLSLGAAAFSPDGKMLETLSVNLFPLPDARQDKDTMAFWKRNPGAWEELQKNREKPEFAMQLFAEWLRDLTWRAGVALDSLVYIGYPVVFDFGFTHWYFRHFLGKDPFGFSALDLKSYAMAVLNTKFKGTTKRNMPKAWFDKNLKHDHVAVHDAVEQGNLFFEMRKHRIAV